MGAPTYSLYVDDDSIGLREPGRDARSTRLSLYLGDEHLQFLVALVPGIDIRTMSGEADVEFWETVLLLAAEQVSDRISSGTARGADPSLAEWLHISGHQADQRRHEARPRSGLRRHGERLVGSYDVEGRLVR